MIVYEYVRNGYRFGLAESAAEAQKIIGTEARHLYEIRAIDIPVVFLLRADPNKYDDDVLTNFAYATLDAAKAARESDAQEIIIAELKS